MYEVRVFPNKGDALIVECARVSYPWEATDVAELISRITTRFIEVIDLDTGKTIRTFND